MSMPLGNPDWQRIVSWRGQILSAQTFSINNAQNVTVAEYVTNWASVFFSLNVGSGVGVTVAVAFYTDATQTEKTASWAYKVTNGTALSVVLPGLGNYFVVNISTAQAGVQNGAYTVAPCNIAVARPVYSTPCVTQAQNLTIPANTTSVFTFDQVMEGDGILWVTPNDASGKIYASVRELGESNTAFDYLTADNLPAVLLQSITRSFITGTSPIQVNLQNTDGAASHQVTFSSRIIAR